MNYKVDNDKPLEGVFPEELIPKTDAEIGRILGYAGICTCCFEPVKNGKEYRFPGSTTTFHARCVDLHPNSYYIRRERRRAAKRAARKEPTP